MHGHVWLPGAHDRCKTDRMDSKFKDTIAAEIQTNAANLTDNAQWN